MKCWESCVSNYHLVSDEPSDYNNSFRFHAHRHDQSCLSMLLKNTTNFKSGGATVTRRPGAKLLALHGKKSLRCFKFPPKFTSHLCPTAVTEEISMSGEKY